MFLDHHELIFVNESMNEDDTNETIINKIIYNCYPNKDPKKSKIKTIKTSYQLN